MNSHRMLMPLLLLASGCERSAPPAPRYIDDRSHSRRSGRRRQRGQPCAGAIGSAGDRAGSGEPSHRGGDQF